MKVIRIVSINKSSKIKQIQQFFSYDFTFFLFFKLLENDWKELSYYGVC